MEMLKMKCLVSALVVGLLAVLSFAAINPNTMTSGYVSDADTAMLWHLDDTSLADSSGNGRHLNEMNAATTWSTGKFNGGVYNGGVSDAHLSIRGPDLPAGVYTDAGIGGDGSFTVEMWFKPDGQQNNDVFLFDAARGGPGGLIRYQADGSLKGIANVNGIGAVTVPGSTVVAPGVWHHVAFTRDTTSGDMYLYLDGVVDGSLSSGAGEVAYWTTGWPTIKIGANAWAAADWFKGNMDEIRVSSVAREFVPEPATLALLSIGGLLLRRRRSSK